MAAAHDDLRTEAPRRRRLLPVGVIVLFYLVVGVFWIVGGGPVADTLPDAAANPRWAATEFRVGLSFVATSALVLLAVLARRARRLDAAVTRADDDGDLLAASEERNRLQETALSVTANAVVITDRDGTIEWVNAAFETMSGYASSTAVGATSQLLRSGEHDEQFHRDMWTTILSGQVWRGQVVNRHRSGELYTVEQTITPVVTSQGEIQNFVTVHEDITERVRAERELEDSRLQLQALFDHALDAIILTDDQGRYIEVNPAVCALTGYTRAELLDMDPGGLTGVDGQSAAGDGQSAAGDGHVAEFAHAGADSGRIALRHKDGHIVQAEYRAVSDIQPGVHLTVLHDVTTQIAILRALTLAEAEFRELAENAVDVVAKLRVDVGNAMAVVYVNPAATTILGYPHDRLRDDPDLLPGLLLHSDDLAGDLADADDLLATSVAPIRTSTVQVARADGRLVWLEVRSTVTDRSDSSHTVQFVARDVTARSEMMRALEQALGDQLESAEQLRVLNVMKDTFLQNVSHELRTPLTSILGFAQLLADPRLGLSPADTLEFHRSILNNALRLERLLADLTDIDRFSRGRHEPSREPTDVTQLVERVLHDTELGDRPLELDLEPITMELDGPRVERLVANLLRNIVQHTPAGTRGWVRTRATPDGMELVVDDDGPGIPAADRQHLTQPFGQGATSASSPHPGTGIGLSLVSAFARMHGGDLTITDGPAGGTRATVTLHHAGTADPAEVTSDTHDWDELAARFTTLLLDRNRAGAADLVGDLMEQGTDIRDVYLLVFAPSQHDIGRRWQRGEITVAVEHYCTAATQQIMYGLHRLVFDTEPDGRRLVMVCAAEELHDLGASMVGDFLQLDGWDVSYLGANVPTESVVAETRRIGAHMVAISVSLPRQIPFVAEIIATLRRELPAPPAIIVGGLAFNLDPDQWTQVGADGYAPNASEAVDVAASLVPRPALT